jgi:nitrate/nitrite-specific signal transduction histidine kinase
MIGLESVKNEKSWSEDTTTLLTIVGEVFTNAFARKNAEERLQKANNLLELRVQQRTSDLKKSNDLLEAHISQLNFLNISFNKLSSIIIIDKLLPAILNVFIQRFPMAAGSILLWNGENFN